MINKLKLIVFLACMFVSHAAFAVRVSDVMEIHVVPNVGDTPVTVNFDNVYSDAIPVCTYNLPSQNTHPAVVRIVSIGSTSMSIRLGVLTDLVANPVPTPGNVHCVIVEEGEHDVNGTPIEARKVLSTGTVGSRTSPNWTTGTNNGWVNSLEDITSLITHPFVDPIVLGQVITSNDPLASIFYANDCSNSRRNIPFQTTNSICVGKHISKEIGTRVDEYIGVIIAGETTTTGASGSTGGFRAGATGTTIAGVDNNPPYRTSTVENYSVGIASQVGELGGDGAWVVLYGPDPLANGQIALAIDESEIDNPNRGHRTEPANYLVVTVPTITLKKTVVGGGPRTAADFTLNFSGITNNSGIDGSTSVTSFPVQPGTYTLSESSLAQYDQTDLSCTGGGVLNGNELQVSAFDYTTCTFTNTFDASSAAGVNVSGNVFEDSNSNGTQDGTEDWGSAVSVFVNIVDTLNPTTVLQSLQVSPGAGDYTFAGVPPGDYDIIITDSQVNVSPVAPNEWVFVTPSAGTKTVTVAGGNVAGENFGLFHTPILNVEKTTTTPTVINTDTGTTADYQITLTNTASFGGDAEGVTISDVLPADFSFDLASAVISTPNSTTCLVTASRNSTVNPADGATGTLSWGDWTVPAGCSVVINFSADIPDTVADGTYDSSASVITTTSPAVINNFVGTVSNDENVTVTSAVLTVAKESLIKTAASGGTTNYRITVSNTGTTTATNVVVQDQLPQTYFSFSSTTSISGLHTRTTNGNPTGAPNSPVWFTFDIPAGGSVIIEFVANIDAFAPNGFYQNSVNVTSANAKIINNFDGAFPANNTDDVEVASGSQATDLSITKTDGITSAIPGNAISYTIEVTNTGLDVEGASITDIFDPTIFDVPNVNWSCSITSGTGACATPSLTSGNINTAVDLTSGSVATIDVFAAPILPNATGTISNSAAVDPPSTMIDSNGSNNSAIDDDTVLNPTGDLVVTKDDGISSVVAGTSTTYTITATNTGPSDMNGASITDFFDSNDVDVDDVEWTCAIDGGSVGSCGAATGSGDINTSLDLTAGSSATITAIVPVLETAVSPLNNTVTIVGPSGFTDSNASNNFASDNNTISLAQSDLELTVITSNATPGVGENFTYTLAVVNNGASGATNIVVTDTFSSNQINIVSAVPQQGAGGTRTFVINNNTTSTWTIPFLPAGNTANLLLTANIGSNGIQTNTAEITSADQDDPDSPHGNGVLAEDDMDSVNTNVGGATVEADLRISKTDLLTSATAGSTIAYNIVVTNDASSNDDVVGASVEDIFDPAFFDVPNVSWTCTITTGSGACGSPGPVLGNIVNTTVDLTVGSAATFTVTAPILPNATGTIVNTATVTSPVDVTETNPGNNSAIDNNTALSESADLSITNTVSNPTPNIGELVTFSIEVTNAGPSDGKNVTVRDILPSGYTFNLAGTSATQGSYSNATGDWTIGTLSASAPVQTLTLAATVNSTGNYQNFAQVWTSDAADVDSTPANNVVTEDDYDEASITLVESNLSLTQITNNQTPVPGANVSFTITVSNAGPDTASAVIVEDRLPTGFTYVSSTIMTSNDDEPSTACTHANGVVTCNLNTVDTLVNDVILVIASANASTEGTTQTNVAEIISATENDPNSVHGNNVLLEDDQASIDLVISSAAQADLSLTTDTSNVEPIAEEPFDYTVVVSNAGPSSASNVEIVDTLPAGVDFVSAVITGGDNVGSCSVTGQVVTCDLDTITTTAPKTVTITVTAQTAQQGNTLTNSVEVTEVDNIDPDSIKNNGVTTEDDYAEVELTVSLPLGITITGNVYEDNNFNSIKDGSETWAGGSRVIFLNLVDDTGAVFQSVEVSRSGGGGGDYSFANVPDGVYTVVVTDSATSTIPILPSIWNFLEPASGSQVVTVEGLDVELEDFGIFAGSIITGSVFADNGTNSVAFTGTPNDGIRDGVELGLSNITVSVHHGQFTSLIYSTAITDVNGDYTLYVPTSSAGQDTVGVSQINATNYNSTGADVGNTSGTYDFAGDKVTFLNIPGSRYTNVNFGDVLNSSLSNESYQSVVAGDTASHPHVFTAGTSGLLILSNSSAAPIPGWSEVFYLDTNCNGLVNAGDTEITSAISVVSGEEVCIVLEQTTSFDSALGQENLGTVTASYTYANSGILFNYTQVDTTVIVPDPDGDIDELFLEKAVDKTSAAPGELITYTVDYSNISVGPLRSLDINDYTPPYTTFVSASCGTLAEGLIGCSISDPGVGNNGALEWTMAGAMSAGAKGTVSFTVRVD